MRVPHFFEFMDQGWLPESLAATLREILSCGNAVPFRRYYGWVAEHVARISRERDCRQIVELGAGTAPITRELLKIPSLNDVKFVVCDLRPDRATYEALNEDYPDRVAPRFDSVDFSIEHFWPEGTLLILSATFHHIPPKDRHKVLEALSASADGVVIAEPLRKTLLSMAFVFLSVVPALLLPGWYFARPGKFRRFFWCWLCPVAPVMFWWDGLVSCLRMNSNQQWLDQLGEVIPLSRQRHVSSSLFSQLVCW